MVFLLLATALATALSACGHGEANAPATAAEAADVPRGAELAAGALEALDPAGSAHYVLDARLEFTREGAERGAALGDQPITLHAEGDGSRDRGTADLVLDLGESTIAARILADKRSFFVRFMDVWYGKVGAGFDPEAAREYELLTPERVREYFDDVFVGEVSDGPHVGGKATWKFEGHLNVDGLVALVEEYQGDLHETAMDQLRAFGEVTRLSFLVGKDDGLPYRQAVDLNLTHDQALKADEDPPVDSLELQLVLELSEFGKEVKFDPPERYEPLDKLVEELFAGLR
jgi:hypothetical protein